MSESDIQVKCSRCLGTGQEEFGSPPAFRTCTACDGLGFRAKDKLDTTEIVSKVDKALEQLEYVVKYVTAILEKVEKL